MVHGRHHGQPDRRDFQQAYPQTLIVVHHVEVVPSIGQQARGTQTEGARLGEARRPHRGQLEKVDAVPDLPGMRDPEGVGFAIHVEAGYLGQHYPGVEAFGVGLTGEHLDVVSQFDQAAARGTARKRPGHRSAACCDRTAEQSAYSRPVRYGFAGRRADRCHGERFVRGGSELSGHVSGL